MSTSARLSGRPKSGKELKDDKIQDIETNEEKLEDKIIKMFTIPEVKRHIDNDTGLLTMDESEFRIITLLVAFASLLLFIASLLCIELVLSMKEIKMITLDLEKGNYQHYIT